MVGPLPKLAECTSGVGVINTAPEIDGVIRRVPLLMKIGEEVYPNMAIETIRVAVGDPSYQVKADESGIIAMRVPAYATINTDTNARVWVRWNKEFKTISASAENFDELAGTTVIIAMTAEGLGGVVATPTGEQYGRNLVISMIAMPNRSPASSSNSSSYRLIVSPSSIVCSVCADIT